MITRKTVTVGTTALAVAAIFTASCSTVETKAADSAPTPDTQPAQQVGLQEGESVPAFHVTTIAGRLKGKSLCYV